MAKSKKNDPKAIHLSVNTDGKFVLPVHDDWQHGWWFYPALMVMLGAIAVAGNAAGIFPLNHDYGSKTAICQEQQAS